MNALLVNIFALAVLSLAVRIAFLQFAQLRGYLAGRQLQRAAICECIDVMENPHAPEHTRTLAGRLALIALCPDSQIWFAKHHKDLAAMAKRGNKPISDSEKRMIGDALSMVVMLCMFYHARLGATLIRSFRAHMHQHRQTRAETKIASSETLHEVKAVKPQAAKVRERIEGEVVLAVA